MSPSKTILPLLLLSAIAGLAFWSLTRGSPGVPSVAAGGSVADGNYQALVEAQVAQDQRLDRLEAMIGRIAARSGLAQPAGLQGKPELDVDHMPAGRAQSMRDMRQRDTQAAFVAEPISAAWSARNEKMIVDAFSSDTLAGEGAPEPRLHDAQCRSRTCRIEVVYASDSDAEAGLLFLLSHIGGTLGRTTPFQRTLPDGNVQIIMYSSVVPPRPPGGPDRH